MRSLAPDIAVANATNWPASRACDTGKFVISKSWVSSSDTVSRTAAPRMSRIKSARFEPLAFEKRTLATYSEPGWK